MSSHGVTAPSVERLDVARDAYPAGDPAVSARGVRKVYVGGDGTPIRILDGVDLATILVSTILISFAATLDPAYQAARLTPVEAIRHE